MAGSLLRSPPPGKRSIVPLLRTTAFETFPCSGRRAWANLVGMTFMLSSHAPGLAALTIVAACGGNAIVDPIDGASSSSASGSGGSTTGISSSSSSSAGGAAPTGACADACASLDDCGGGSDECIASCESIEQRNCGDLHQTWLSCSLGETNTLCGPGPGQVCEPQLRDYLDCDPGFAGELGCIDEGEGCSCSVFVSPGIELKQRCDGAGNCECLAGGSSLGFCPGNDFACAPVANCCAGLFYTSDL